MPNVLNLLSEETFAAKMDAQNEILAKIAATQKIVMAPTSWLKVREIVREGFASELFSIGDQFICQRNGSNLIWDVIGINHNVNEGQHSLTLQMHDCFPTTMQFDAQEAIYYVENALAAGKYCFIPYKTGDYKDWFFWFEADSEIPAGAQLIITAYDSTYGYPSKLAISQQKGGAAIGEYDITPGEQGTRLNSSKVNAIEKVQYGSNIYKDSAIRQWLNSDAAAGYVWTPQHDFDRPPAWADTADGFLRGLDPDFLSVVAETAITTNVDSDSNNSYTVNDKFFLLSRSEVYGGSEGLPGEGSYYGFYRNYTDLSQEGTGADRNRIKLLNGANQGWWLRTLATSSSYEVKVVAGNTGRIAINNANYASGVAPACTIM